MRQGAHFKFGDDTALVAVQHMLQQTVDLFNTISEWVSTRKHLCARQRSIQTVCRSIETLRDMGVTVVETTKPPPGEFHSYFEQDIDRLWHVVAGDAGAARIKRLLVLDDGGVCITRVPPEILHRYTLCGVEQTSNGMFLFEEKPPPFAVMSWARAAVKLEIGGPIFSQCFFEKLNSEFLRHAPLRRAQLGIIGMGSIGRGCRESRSEAGRQRLLLRS